MGRSYGPRAVSDMREDVRGMHNSFWTRARQFLPKYLLRVERQGENWEAVELRAILLVLRRILSNGKYR